VLTHLVPWNERERTLEEACSARFDGPISLAASGRAIDLS
jgi:hypothetical protein